MEPLNLYENWIKKRTMLLILKESNEISLFNDHKNLIYMRMIDVIYQNIKDYIHLLTTDHQQLYFYENMFDKIYHNLYHHYDIKDYKIYNYGLLYYYNMYQLYDSLNLLTDYEIDEEYRPIEVFFRGIHKIIEINLFGTFNCCRAIVPNMIENNYGRIVNVASVAGKDGNANASAYSAGKAGAIGLTKSLGKELADKNIAVNAVTPAGAKTRILDQMSKENVQMMLSKVPRGRFLEVEEFTSLICWLSSEENTFSTAAVFDISGGRSTY